MVEGWRRNWKVVEGCRNWWKEKGNLWWKEKERKKIRKRKRKCKKEDIFLEEKVEMIRVADSRDSVADAENFRKNTEIVPKSNILERLAKIIKNQEYNSKTHGEIRFKK